MPEWLDQDQLNREVGKVLEDAEVVKTDYAASVKVPSCGALWFLNEAFYPMQIEAFSI